jgi:uncharacterized protein (DUF302 family)
MAQEQTNPSNHTLRSRLFWGLGGTVLGILLCGGLVAIMMPRMMLVTKESNLGFNETVAAIEQAIEDQGWSSPGTTDMNKAMAKRGVEFKPQVRLVSMCKAEYAKDVLTTDRYVSSLMPCKMAVWEGDDGKVYVSKMNTGLMGRLFGGNIAKVMGQSVGRDEEAMLKGIVRE